MKVVNKFKFPVTVITGNKSYRIEGDSSRVLEGENVKVIRKGMVHLEGSWRRGGERFLVVGCIVQDCDEFRISQMIGLYPYQGGIPWLDIINDTNIPLRLTADPETDRKGEEEYHFTVQPGTLYRYKGRYDYGIPYGVKLRDIDSNYSSFTLLRPTAQIMYT